MGSKLVATSQALARNAALASFMLILAACGDQDTNASAGNTPPPIAVSVKRVELERLPISLEAVGQAEGSREVEIRARVAGILEKRLYVEGASVKAGQPLFLIDPAPFELAVAQARAELSEARARQEQAQREAERLKSLTDSRAISQREYDEAVSTAKQSAAAIEGAQAKLAEAQLNLSYTTVKAPIGGITGRAQRSEGSLVAANTDLLTTLTQVDPIWVRFSLAESDFERIRAVANRAQVQILGRDGRVAADGGRLNFAGSTVDPRIGTVQLRAEFPNRDQKWFAGQFAKVRILAGEQEGFLVPQVAVVQTEQARQVWVVGAGSKVTLQPVQTANWIGNNWVVTDGLKPGDQVVIDNLMKLQPGVTVQPRAAEAPAGISPTPAADDKNTPASGTKG